MTRCICQTDQLINMIPTEWTNLPKIIFNASTDLNGTASIASKSSSSKSCTLPSISSTKHSRLSTPSLSSSDGKGKRALSFSPITDQHLMRTTTEIPSDISPGKIVPVLTPVIETHDIQCQWSGCDLMFSSPVQLTEHIRSVHIDRLNCRTWFCQWESCSRPQFPFKSLYSLFLHLRTHTQDRPFQCSYPNCSKTFTRSEYLRLHQRSHTGEKPYPCEYENCSKAFSNPSDRTKHMKRTHLNKKEYICQIVGCGKSYTDPSSLRKHVKTVHGEEAFRQKKHKRDEHFDEAPPSILPTIISSTSIPLINSSNFHQSSTVYLEPIHPDDDEDVIVDHGIDMLRNNLEELSVGTVVHSRPRLRPIKEKSILPAIEITGVPDEPEIPDQPNPQVNFRTFPQHRISAQSGSTAYSSMRSDSMHMDNPSNHSSFISMKVQHQHQQQINPSVSPYEYDYPTNNLPIDQHLTLPGSSSSPSHYTELSPSSSFCVSDVSHRSSPRTPNSNPKMAHILYFLRTLDSNE